MKKNHIPIIPVRHLFLALIVVILAANIVDLSARLRAMKRTREKIPYIFMGYKFAGLKDILGKAQTIGYVTDKSLNDRRAALQFAQAQFVLAPVILDLNNVRHEFILFDCSRPEVTLEKIKEAGVVPLRRNQFGIILAKNPGVRPPDPPQGINRR